MTGGPTNFTLAPDIAQADTRHGPLFVLKSDNTIGRSLLTYGEWTEGEIGVLRQALRPNDCIVDVGANIGSHTIALAKAVLPGGCIMAFEPHPKVFQLLSANVVVNGLSNVRLYPNACGAEAGMLWFPDLDYSLETNYGALQVSELRSLHHSIKKQVSQPVPIVILDDVYDLPALRLVKIDVEGMEVDFLKGAERTIRRFRPMLYIENEYPQSSEQLLCALRDLDYIAYWHVVPLFNPDNFRRATENVFSDIACINNVCVPKELGLEVTGFQKVTDLNQHPRRT